MTKKEQIEEMAFIALKNTLSYTCAKQIAINFYNAGYRKKACNEKQAELEAELKKELEEHEAFVKNMKNVLEIEKKNAVREFAEKLKNVIHERDYVQGYAEIGLIEEIDELLKEYEQ